jgi:hypothetical protein
MSEHAIVQVYTLLGNIKSQLTINVLGAMGLPVRLSIFTSEEAVKNHFEENPTKHSSVLVLCDVSFGVRRFRSIQQGTRSASRLPHWTSYAGWIVLVNEKLQYSPDGGTTWIDYTAKPVTATISATGQTTLVVYPGVTEVVNSAVSLPLPRTLRMYYTIGGTTPSFTFATYFNWIN